MFANFRENEQKWVCQKDHQIYQRKKYMQFHLFLLIPRLTLRGKLKTRNHRIGSLASVSGRYAQATGNTQLCGCSVLTIAYPAVECSRQALLPDYNFILQF